MKQELRIYWIWFLLDTIIAATLCLTRVSTLAPLSIILVLTLPWSSLLCCWNILLLEICLPISSTTGENAKGLNPLSEYPVAQTVKNPPATQETHIQSLSGEDPLDSSILAWRLPWIEDPGRLQPMESQTAGHDWATNTVKDNLAYLTKLHTCCPLTQQFHFRNLYHRFTHKNTKICIHRGIFNTRKKVKTIQCPL